ncbi:hypothetical protein ACFWY9_01965 [Amycolatopsis sp. NPDC059027]|uniref:hypothetical protein n=1 Tax=unclassified Amycolatopsis TaxID=2618356 RepID=UPI003671476D
MRTIFWGIAFVAATLFAVEQSPNFSSYSAEVPVLTTDSYGYQYIDVVVPYQDDTHVVRPPLREDEIRTAWPDSVGSSAHE